MPPDTTPSDLAFPRADAALVARLGALPAPNVGDAMERMGAMDSRIQAMWPGARVAGSAFTVWTRGGDNLHILRALEMIEAGDVMVVNGQGDESRALLGDIIGAAARARGVAGFVLDGACRDAEALQEMGMPVFARATSPAGPYKNGPGYVLRTIACGGVAVAPGDVVVGDGDGVVVVPLADVGAVVEAAEAKRDTEAATRAAIEAGTPLPAP